MSLSKKDPSLNFGIFLQPDMFDPEGTGSALFQFRVDKGVYFSDRHLHGY
jgi:hypothetical protein